ncbi:MAG: sulfur carrier protein ThiS [Corynebacterium sp.]|uniref:sulfur carrier protein ThiS n=1 Tax=Corynebacterium sp. TaxID=1720 RepID=UPI00264A0007|nr:sulfur carrier protein ThiS [Corynebacterium sp.]MDN5722145.1 sulfur carrier protein ThiS [Corynebacterium sp.]MDN6283289.1 sulfur carrier protein ThiS [Corynebacterium sp.]MDN6304346.1 sulfur carrier protein ThiS [Corynebacterium sp.]MDN6352857.1 sulfur carrier protein ThiS [Corynebacterium sp.]MDN6367232.1 sulfur carrier protein ThiS [Corynebacterium sp.]
MSITVTVNGDPRTVADTTTVADIVTDVTGHSPDDDQVGVAVAHDSAVVPRSRWTTTMLGEGAEIEIITAMQGG